MKTRTEIITVELCMGSSCYSRGNGSTVQLIESYINENSLDEKILLKGKLCTGSCSNGPCMKINDTKYSHVRPETVLDLIKSYFEGDSNEK